MFCLVGGESVQLDLLCAERPLRGGLCDRLRQRPLSPGSPPARGVSPPWMLKAVHSEGIKWVYAGTGTVEGFPEKENSF